MGIYSNHGLEYRIQIDNNSTIILVNIKESDARLVISEWFLLRKEKWFSIFNAFEKVIENLDNFDIKLNENEEEKLHKILNVYSESKVSHGWFEVNYIWYSG